MTARQGAVGDDAGIAKIDEELEGVWRGAKQPKEALDEAVKRGNEQLERFQKANKS